MNQNYDILFQKIVRDIQKQPKKPSLLLHVCCAPCSTAVLERLMSEFTITVYFYNPNIHPLEEYARRFDELKKFLAEKEEIQLHSEHYDPNDFFKTLDTDKKPSLKTEKERGQRCCMCYELRLKKAANYALKHGFDYFTSALSISPHKDAQAINKIGYHLQENLKNQSNEKTPLFLFADFKKRSGFKRSLELSKEFNLYRQEYCGCIYSQIAAKKREVENELLQ